MRLFPRWVDNPGAIGLLLVRIVAGAAFILHGWPKIQAPLHWMDAFAPGQAPPAAQALAAVAEFGGGIGLILGLLTPLWSLLLVGTMGVAIGTVHLAQGHPFVGGPGEPSFELAAVYLAVSLLLLLVGPGRLSLDAVLFGRSSTSASNSSKGV